MQFKNLIVYRLPANYKLNAEQLTQQLDSQRFAPVGSLEMSGMGWASPTNDDRLVYASHGQLLLKLVTEKKLLPAAVINEAAAIRAVELEEQQGFKPGRKQMKEIKETVTDDLLPRAFSVKKSTHVWIDTINGWLVVDAGSSSTAEDVFKLLVKAINPFPIKSLKVKQSPAGAMTEWLQTDEAPANFTVDAETELKATGETKSSVKYINAMETKQLREHIAGGKRCTRLALTWNDKISFVLTDSLVIKKVALLDVLKENYDNTVDEAGRFEADFALMTGELAQMLAAIVEALGGEDNQQTDWVQDSEQGPAQVEAVSDDTLYPQAVEVVQAAEHASVSLIQRHLQIGYNRAARLVEAMKRSGDWPCETQVGTRQMELEAA